MILVTGAAGSVGGVGRTVVELLRQRNLPVRALVRREDERAAALRALRAEVVVGDLTRAGDVARACSSVTCGELPPRRRPARPPARLPRPASSGPVYSPGNESSP